MVFSFCYFQTIQRDVIILQLEKDVPRKMRKIQQQKKKKGEEKKNLVLGRWSQREQKIRFLWPQSLTKV